MSISWINAVALWGLTLVAIPIAIHLLVRQQTRTVHYPSLRFVRETALAAFRRRAIQDALLLACRAGVIAAAVLALAGPLVHTAARTARHAERVSLAVVHLDDGTVPEELGAYVFRARTFRRPHVTDAIAEAIAWLDAQPPSSREIVFTGAFSRGQITRSDLHLVPPEIGVGFGPTMAPPAADQFTQTSLLRQDGRLVFLTRTVRLTADATQITATDTAPAPDGLVRAIAAPNDQPLAHAALNAALDAGLRWPDRNRRIVVMWEGAPEPREKADLLRMAVPNPASSAATALWRVIDEATPREGVEPIAIPRADLDAWSRPPGGISPQAPVSDEGDRRWLWGTALALLALEWRLRRDRTQTAIAEEERRVA
jgi:hypothetical protein